MDGRNAFAVLMGGARRGTEAAALGELRPSAGARPAVGGARANGGTQLHLDLGQRDFAVATCAVCGMLYGKGLPEEERLHDQFHNAHDAAFRFQGWVSERVVLRDSPRTRLLCVLSSDPPSQQRKVGEVCGRLEKVLGVPEGYLLAPKPPYKVFLWVSTGAVVAAGAGGGGNRAGGGGNRAGGGGGNRGGGGGGNRGGGGGGNRGGGGGGKSRITGVLVAQLQELARRCPLATPLRPRQPQQPRQQQQEHRRQQPQQQCLAASQPEGLCVDTDPGGGGGALKTSLACTMRIGIRSQQPGGGEKPLQQRQELLQRRQEPVGERRLESGPGAASVAGVACAAAAAPGAVSAAAAQQGLCELDHDVVPGRDVVQGHDVVPGPPRRQGGAAGGGVAAGCTAGEGSKAGSGSAAVPTGASSAEGVAKRGAAGGACGAETRAHDIGGDAGRAAKRVCLEGEMGFGSVVGRLQRDEARREAQDKDGSRVDEGYGSGRPYAAAAVSGGWSPGGAAPDDRVGSEAAVSAGAPALEASCAAAAALSAPPPAPELPVAAEAAAATAVGGEAKGGAVLPVADAGEGRAPGADATATGGGSGQSGDRGQQQERREQQLARQQQERREQPGGGEGVRVVVGVRGLWVEPGSRRRGVARRMLDAARCCMVPGFLVDRAQLAFSACAAAAAAGDTDGGAAFSAFAVSYIQGSSRACAGSGSSGGSADVLMYDDDDAGGGR